MNFNDFFNEFNKVAAKSNINIDEQKALLFYNYMLILLEWNEKINLTAITNPKDIIIKHFIDSLLIAEDINNNTKVIDIGTGAGFPGIPLKIYNNSINITLLDSLNKRTIFLKEVIDRLKLKNVEIIHGRAEDFAQNNKYREQYDIAVSRAVAPLNILVEYLVPYIKVSGKIIAMKGSNAINEIEDSKNALKLLSSTIKECKKLYLPDENGERFIITIEKNKKTSNIYPRKAGIPKKNPL